MALDKRVIDIPIGGGMQEKLDEKIVEPPQMVDVINGRFLKGGTIRKRLGNVETTPAGGNTGTPHTVFVHENQLHLLTTLGIERFNSTETRWRQPQSLTGEANSGEVHPTVPVQVSAERITRSTRTISGIDVATTKNNGLVCYAWFEATQLFVRIDQIATGVTILGPVELTSAAAIYFDIRVAAAGDTFIVLAHDGTTLLIKWTCDTTVNPMVFSAGVDISATGDFPFDLETDFTNSVAHLVTNEGAGSGTRFRTIASTGSVTTNVLQAGFDMDVKGRVLFHIADGNIWLGFVDSGSPTLLQGVTLTTAYAIVTGPFTAHTRVGTAFERIDVIEDAASGFAWFLSEETRTAAVTEHAVRWQRTSSAGAASSQLITVHHMRIVAKGFLRLGEPHSVLAYEHPPFDTAALPSGVIDPPQPRAFLCQPYSHVTGGAQAFISAQAICLLDRVNSATSARMISSAVPVSTTAIRFATRTIGATDDIDGIDAVDFEFPGDPMPNDIHGGDTLLAGGLLWSYDGNRATEAQPHFAPEGPGLTAGAGVGGVDPGAHQWMIVWEWEDARGNIHRSAPSRASTFTVIATSETITLEFPDLTIRARDGTHAFGVRAAIFRTKVAGTQFFLVTRAIPAAATTAGMVTVVDAVPDTTIEQQENIYTEGGVLANDTPPPLQDILVAKRRMFGINAEDRTEIWFSKFLDPTTAPEFSGALKIQIPRGKGVALAALDERLIIFTETEIYAVHGDGPLNTGQQDSFSSPILVSGDVGCLNRGSVVQGPFGVMFQAQAGIYSLSRNLQTQYIGANVEDQLGTKTITAAIHLPKATEVRFQTRAGTELLVWNYLFNAWARWDDHDFDHAVVFNDLGAYVGGAELIDLETVGTFKDQGTEYSMTLLTPWIKPAGFQGFVRIWRMMVLGEFIDEHDLRVRIGYDYKTAFETTHEVKNVDLESITATPWPYQVGFHIEQQKVQSIRFEISDQPSGGPSDGEGFTLAKISLELGVKRGSRRLPQDASR